MVELRIAKMRDFFCSISALTREWKHAGVCFSLTCVILIVVASIRDSVRALRRRSAIMLRNRL